ncbi:YitT family protein [Phaeobacter sp. HF9A]|uniref:YitT family protein n=1 Tax=Phaeobacter sp. HF9A TaxID=2721561 RepID=UPI0014301745|nr:YitT family protein [Phaeobacter sp. HF9A]NIZ15201.1 YitT family protein [Phaeobacter sp. HF9A]
MPSSQSRPVLTFFDLQGLIFGILMCALGVTFLKAAGLVTGQTAGIALLLSYVLPWGFGPLFLVISLPFLILAWTRRGAVFALRTVAVVIGISLGAQVLPQYLGFVALHPGLAAILGGACSGSGLIAIFRHNASAGGMTIVGIIIEHRTGFKAGWFQLAVDAAVFAASALVLTPSQLFYSFIGAMITNLIIVWNFDVAQSGTGRPGYGRATPKGADLDA